MAEIVYKLFFFMMLVIFFSFGFLIKVKLDYWKNYHWLDFLSIDKDFTISTWWADFRTNNIIYVWIKPSECEWINKNSIRCLSELKKQGGVYNWLAFFSWTNTYK